MLRSTNCLDPLDYSVRRAGHWRVNSILAIVVAVSVIAPASLPRGIAVAQLTLNPASATPGTHVTATGTGFPSFGGNQIRITVEQSVVATVPYQAPNFSATFAAPGLAPGLHTVTACVANTGTCSSAPGTSAQAQLRTLAPPPPPPPTSAPPPPPTSAPPPRPTSAPPPPAPTGPGELQISLDPLCCDPPAPSGPVDLLGPTTTPTLGVQNPGGVPSFPDLYVLGIEVTQNIQSLFEDAAGG